MGHVRTIRAYDEDGREYLIREEAEVFDGRTLDGGGIEMTGRVNRTCQGYRVTRMEDGRYRIFGFRPDGIEVKER